jgi:hypothetical protein
MSRAGPLLLYLAALAGGTYLTFRPTFDSAFARLQANPGDTLLNHYLLEHTWQVVSNPEYRGTLLTPPFFFPAPLTLAYSENLLGVAPVYWALRLGLPADVAFQVWMVLLNALNFVAFAAVCRWLGCGPVCAAFGGYLWAFGMVHVFQLGHQQLIPRFWVPLGIYHGWRLATEPDLRPLNRVLACVFLQAAACFHTGWFLAAGLAVFVPAAAAGRPGGWGEFVGFVRGRVWAVVRIVGLWGLALGLFFAPYVVANRGAERSYAEIREWIPTLSTWLASNPGWGWHDALRPPLGPVLDRLFTGFSVYGLMLAAGVHVWLTRRDPGRPPEFRLVAACLVTAGVWFLLTLNVGDFRSAWYWVRYAPGGQAIRCVARVYLVVYSFGGLAAVVWLNAVTRRLAPGWRAAVLAAVCGVVVVEQTGTRPDSFPKADFYPAVEENAARLRGADVGYVVYRPGVLWAYNEVFGMWVGLRANVPVANGYSGRRPAGYHIDEADVDAALRRWLAGKYRGRVTVVDPTRGVVRFLEVE